MLRVGGLVVVLGMVLGTPAFAQFFSIQDSLRTVGTSKSIAVEQLELKLTPGWVMKQSAEDRSTKLLNFAKGNQSVQLYVRDATDFSVRELLTTDAEIVDEFTDSVGSLTWSFVSIHKAAAPEVDESFAIVFSKEFNSRMYYGIVSAKTAAQTKKTAAEFVTMLGLRETHSLTGPEYTGKKYYLGFGRVMSGDPSEMQNEVKYDVQHTHDIFTKEIGGNYIGTKLVGISTSSATNVRAKWKELKDLMTANDMYVQYSSGHGSSSGLEVGVSYNEIRDNALSYPARELVVLIMACYSGNLVSGFDAKKSVWQDFPSIGRTLFVMASSKASETSSTGPGTDPDEAGGPDGSAGSAFGWALWKSLIGYADGYVDGIKDTYLSLEEIQKYTIAKTKDEGGHTPVVTGAFDPKLKMNRVPNKEFLLSLEHSTEGLSDEEIRRQIQELDAAMRISSR